MLCFGLIALLAREMFLGGDVAAGLCASNAAFGLVATLLVLNKLCWGAQLLLLLLRQLLHSNARCCQS